MRGAISLSTTADDGTNMNGEIMASDVRWLRKMLARISERAERAHPNDRTSFRFTTTEVQRAERLASTLGWHLQHFDIGRKRDDERPNHSPERPDRGHA